MDKAKTRSSSTSQRWTVFFSFALAYFLSYFYRVVNAVIAPDLIRDLHIGPADLGLLTSAYFISFALFQLPLGVLLDRFGPRRIASVLLLLAAAGATTFGLGRSLWGLSIGRALIGLGVSSGYMAAIKAFTLWFPTRQWPRINGFHLAAGGLGAISATLPVEWLLKVTTWRGLFPLLGLLTLMVGGFIFFRVPEKKDEERSLSFRDQWQGVVRVFTSSLFWKVAPLATLSQSSAMAIQGLWAGPWLRDMAGLSRLETAGVLFWVSAAMMVGFMAVGFIAERLDRFGIKPMTTGVGGCAIFLGAQALLTYAPPAWATPLWILFGFLGTSGTVIYPALAMQFPAALAGRAATGLNVLVFSTTFLAQWGIGAVIGWFPLTPSGGYSPQGYQLGFTLLLILQGLALGSFFMIRKPPAAP